MLRRRSRFNEILPLAVFLHPLIYNPKYFSVVASLVPSKENTHIRSSTSLTSRIMTSKILTNNDDASALRELKEVIQKQSKEIDTLKAALAIKASTKDSKLSSASHGPPSDIDPGTYLHTPFYKIAFQRVGWLAIFLISLSFTAVIMNGFEHTLSQQIELAYFVPLLAGHGGNTGGQAVSSVLSALSTKSITSKDAFKIIRKEAMTGMTVGLILGSIVGPAAHFGGGISRHVSTVVFFTLPWLSTIAATLASSIPFACHAAGLDPAIIAAPAITQLF